MQYSGYWMQGLQPAQGEQSQPDPLEHDAQRAASADWKGPSSSNGNGTPNVGQQQSHPQPSPIDLSDFGLADFSGEQPAQTLETPARN